MKNLFLIVISFILFTAARASERFPAIDEIVKAVRSGQAANLSKYVQSNIEVTIPGRSDRYSRAQALIILQDFFRTSGVKNFDVKQKSVSGNNEYCIGTLQTRSGAYRTMIYVSSKKGKQWIKELRFLPA